MIVEGGELRTSLAVVHYADEVAQLQVHHSAFYGVFFDAGRAFGDDRVGSEDRFTCIDIHEVPL